jgi:hypothetical protein
LRAEAMVAMKVGLMGWRKVELSVVKTVDYSAD